MKGLFSITLIITLAAALGACKKDDAAVPAPTPKNEWRFADTMFKAGYTETDTRHSYVISFRAGGGTGLTHGLTLQFAARPDAGNYVVTDTAIAAGQVRVTLENGLPPAYVSTLTGEPIMQTTIRQGKRTFTGTGIRVVRDTIPALADTLTVHFELTEF